MTKVRAKFECVGSTENPEYESKSVTFSPVIDGGEENKSFSKYTPSGSLTLEISQDTEAYNSFKVGQEYYLDFTEA